MDRLPDEEQPGSDDKRTGPRPSALNWILLLAVGAVLVSMVLFARPFGPPEVSMDLFRDALEKGYVKSLTVTDATGEGELHKIPRIQEKKEGDEKIDPDAGPVIVGWKEVDKAGDLKFRVLFLPSSQSLDKLEELAIKHGVKYQVKRAFDPTWNIIMVALALPVILLVIMWLSIRRS